MAALLNDSTPMYTDQLIAWHNQRIWWVTCSLFVLLALSIGDNVSYHFRPAPPPYVLETNEQGHPVGQVLPVTSIRAIPDAFLRARLGDFIHDAFTVDRDSDEESYIFDKTQAMVTGQAAQRLDAWYNRDGGKRHPKVIPPYTWVEASVTDTLKLAERNTYQVDYRTITHSNNDQTKTTQYWRATLHVIVGHSQDPEALGLFVNELDVQEVKQ
jgi:type IV secretory pathway TrbF-like protein